MGGLSFGGLFADRGMQFSDSGRVETVTVIGNAAVNETAFIKAGVDTSDRTVTPAVVYSYTVPAKKIVYISGFFWRYNPSTALSVFLRYTHNAVTTNIQNCSGAGANMLQQFIPYICPIRLEAGDVLEIYKSCAGSIHWTIVGWIDDA